MDLVSFGIKLHGKVLDAATKTKVDHIYDYIYKQLQNVLTTICCASWLRAFVTEREQIDWENIQILTMAQGYSAAMRLKLTTVRILSEKCYNIRSTIFTRIENGLQSYLQRLTEFGLDHNAAAVMKVMEENASDELAPVVNQWCWDWLKLVQTHFCIR